MNTKQNITLSIEKDILKRGRVIAAHRETSISKMLSDTLKRIVDKEEQYEASKRRARQYLKKGFHLGGEIRGEREALQGLWETRSGVLSTQVLQEFYVT